MPLDENPGLPGLEMDPPTVSGELWYIGPELFGTAPPDVDVEPELLLFDSFEELGVSSLPVAEESETSLTPP